MFIASIRRMVLVSIIFLVNIFCLHNPVLGQNTEDSLTIYVPLSSMKNHSITISVFDEPNFLEVPLASSTQSVTGDTLIFRFVLPSGVYAISGFYDKNGNGKLDRNFVGKPKEPVGFSNNIRPKFGPPKFDECSFSMYQTTNLIINLQ